MSSTASSNSVVSWNLCAGVLWSVVRSIVDEAFELEGNILGAARRRCEFERKMSDIEAVAAYKRNKRKSLGKHVTTRNEVDLETVNGGQRILKHRSLSSRSLHPLYEASYLSCQ